jgi:hypothetical protein
MPPKSKAKPAKAAAPAKAAPATPTKGKSNGHVFLVDGSSYIFRAYFAMFKAAQSRGKALTLAPPTVSRLDAPHNWGLNLSSACLLHSFHRIARAGSTGSAFSGMLPTASPATLAG